MSHRQEYINIATPRSPFDFKNDINHLLSIQGLTYDVCIGKYDEKKGPSIRRPKYLIFEFTTLLCLISGARNMCFIEAPKKMLEYFNSH